MNLIVGAGQNDVISVLEYRWEGGITLVFKGEVCEVEVAQERVQ